MLEETGTPAESPLPPAILRGLGDRSYDKRKNAALDVTALIKSLQEAGERECISNVITLLAQEFTRSRNVHHRKGGLIGLAACAIGLVPEIDRFLHLLIPPVLECFDDPESRVCYYACESLYNISKVARTSVLKYFNLVFDGLCKLFSHMDIDVKNGANLLDRLIKDIVTESDTFDIESFIPLLQKQIRRTKPYIRQLIVGWIVVLNAVPDINMLDYLPELLDGLFNMLSDNNREIQQCAENALEDFLREIKEAEIFEFGPMVTILVSQCKSLERSHRLAALKWMNEFILMGETRLVLFHPNVLSSVMYCISDQEPDINLAAKIANQGLMDLVKSTSENFELVPLLQILTAELSSEHITTRVAALSWIKMLHEKDPVGMNKSIPNLLPSLLKTVSDVADEVVLINLQILASISSDKKQFLRVLNSLVLLFAEDRILLESRGALVIRKLCVMLDSRSIYLLLAEILNNFPQLEFVSQMVQTLNLILLTAPELFCLRKSLKNCFNSETISGYSSSSGSSGNGNNNVGSRSSSSKSNSITKPNNTNNTNNTNTNTNNTNSNTMAITNNGNSHDNDDTSLFTSLFHCWSNNPVATFSLCLLAQAYDLSAKLILKFAEVDVTVGFLMQIDKLVQLLESPIFIHLRLQLLEVNTKHHGDLLKSLYGLLMLLPQSLAYRTLSDRLVTVSSLQMHIGFSENRINYNNANNQLNSQMSNSSNSGNSGNNNNNNKSIILNKNIADSKQQDQDSFHDSLLNRFVDVQDKHVTFRLSIIQQKKLRPLSGVYLKIGPNGNGGNGGNGGVGGKDYAEEGGEQLGAGNMLAEDI